MATRSVIAYKFPNQDRYWAIYCHWDGDSNGRILVRHYKDESKIIPLMLLGNLSSLGPTLGVDQGKLSQNQILSSADQCIAIGRDLNITSRDNERLTELTSIEDLIELGSQWRAEFIYLFDHIEWFAVIDNHDKIIKVKVKD